MNRREKATGRDLNVLWADRHKISVRRFYGDPATSTDSTLLLPLLCYSSKSPSFFSPPSPGCSSAFQLRDLDASAHTLPGTNRPCFSPFFGACHPLLVEGLVVMLR